MAWKGWKPAPLPSSFMLIALIGFAVSAVWVFPMNTNWGITFLILFTAMFIASMVSMMHAPVEAELAFDKRKRKR